MITNERQFDLVRFMRSELHQANLIDEDEYFWLCCDAPLAKGEGSPSPRRLEDYDAIRVKTVELERERDELRKDVERLTKWTSVNGVSELMRELEELRRKCAKSQAT